MEVYDWESAIKYVFSQKTFYYHPRCVLHESGGLIYIKQNEKKVIKRIPENALKYLNDNIEF